MITKTLIPKEKKDWSVIWQEYYPPVAKFNFIGKPWADPDIGEPKFNPKWNQIDEKIDRRSHLGEYKLSKDGYPLNPMGRTGIRMRGVLGRWGPNHAADPIVTRWKRDRSKNIIKDPISNKPILQFVSILRSDVMEWAIPGGMVDPGEQVSDTLKREFCEESLNFLEKSVEERKQIQKGLETILDKSNGTIIYRGVVDDPRNTDNAWIETVAVNFHDEDGSVLDHINLCAGDDAQRVNWVDIDRSKLRLYANHLKFIEITVENRMGNW